jgi:uncharacterized damage-inducible protein DinB
MPAMTRSLLDDAFAHHVWATLRVLDVCEALTPEQRETTAAGTYGSIIATLRHLVGADSGYLFRLSGGRFEQIEDEEEERMGLPELRAAMELNGTRWPEVLAEEIDPDELILVRQEDGSEFGAPKGVRIAQVIHHGTDHRSQICTVLTTIGIEPPPIDVWDYGDAAGKNVERAAPAAE